METTISKSQLEVWEWKDILYDEIKNLSEFKRIEYLINKVKTTSDKLKADKKSDQVYRNSGDVAGYISAN